METIITVVCTVFACSGFWTFVTALIQKHGRRKTADAQMLRGLGHDRICYLGEKYIGQGYISKDDYENLHDYLFLPYKALGGNGTAEKIMKEIEKLPISAESRIDK